MPMIRHTPISWICLALLLWVALQAGCAPSQKQEKPHAAAETIKEVKTEPKTDQTATEPEPKESKPKRTWKGHAKDDWGDLGHNLKEDVLGLWSGENLVPNLIVLGGAGGLTAVSIDEWDRPVRRHFDERRDRLEGWDEVGNVLGHPGTHWGVMGLFYTYAKLSDDPTTLETSKRLAEALILNDLTTLVLKLSTGRNRPNGDHFSFPSGHVSSSFALAAVLDGMYGHWVGMPLYAVGAFVGLSRLDARQHHLSDVIFGAALGYVFGRTVTKVRERKVLGFEVAPWVDPEADAGGVLFQRRF
ncbi:MAG: phosphatase PAP2 family protein [Planctomycetota bacterium]